MGKLEGKVAVITGGSSGMALASAKRFVEEGAYVFITGRRQEALDEAVRLIGRNVTGVRGDAANLDDLDRLFDTVKREKGKIDVLYASAGTGEAVPLGEITEQHFDATFGLNTRGTLFTVQKALPLFNDGGSIFMTGSVASFKGFPGYSVYAASKAALHAFARGWLNELKGRNIRVNVLHPGPIATPMQDQVLDRGGEADVRVPDPAGNNGAPRGNRGGRAVSCFGRFELREWGGVIGRRRLLGHLNVAPKRYHHGGENSMSIEKNIQTVKDFFAAIGRGDREALLALVAEDIEWIIPGEDWPLAGTHRGHAGLANLLETASKSIETSTEPSRVRSAGRPGPGRRLREGKDQSHEQDVRGRLDLRHHGPGRQTDAASGSTSTRRHWRGPRRWTRPGRRSAGHPRPFGLDRAVDRPSHTARSSNAQP